MAESPALITMRPGLRLVPPVRDPKVQVRRGGNRKDVERRGMISWYGACKLAGFTRWNGLVTWTIAKVLWFMKSVV